MILSQRQLEEIAASTTKDFNRFFFGNEVDKPDRSALPTPIDQFAKNYLGLRVSFARLSPDGSICGVTAYADTEYKITELGVTRTLALKLELPILFGAFYGLRRSEAIGLKWDAIDFYQNTIMIRHTVTSCDLDGKRVLVASDTTKTKSSMRTLPLVPFMRERLLALKEEQQENRRLCGRSYIKEYLEYVCVNEIGDLIKPHYVTESFPKLLKAKGMRQIRYHDLRHSCASLLLANGVPMKQIQEWLGHSDFSTTANIYAHLDYSSKLTSADAMLNGLGFAQN